ncbi:hypothetical protein ACR3K2_32280 [Cryptosporidium serpentis]
MIQSNTHFNERIVKALRIWSKNFPTGTEKCISNLCDLFPDISKELCERLETPLLMIYDKEECKYFIGCTTNRVGNLYRSPYSGKFYCYEDSFGTNTNIVEQENTDSDSIKQSLESIKSDIQHLSLLESEYHQIYEQYCKYYCGYGIGLGNDQSQNGILLSNVYCYDIAGDSFGTTFTMKHVINPLSMLNLDFSEASNLNNLIYYLDIIHNVETVVSHVSGTAIYRLGSTYFFGFKKINNSDFLNKDSMRLDACKTNWIEHKQDFNITSQNPMQIQTLGRATTMTNSLDNSSGNTITNNTLLYHLKVIGKLIENTDNTMLKYIQNVLIDSLINIINNIHTVII